MNRAHIELMIEGALNILPDPYLSDIDLDDDDWGSAVSVGRLLLNIGLETVQEFEKGLSILSRAQSWLVALLREGSLDRRERVEAGNLLAKLGDPRFDSAKWNLPSEPLLGFVEIPAGPFIMGELEEKHETSLPTYYIARYPVTVAQFKELVLESDFSLEFTESLKGLDNHPMVLISWDDAIVYAKWLGGKLIALSKSYASQKNLSKGVLKFWEGLRDGRLVVTLPSEAEWEKAARGVDGRSYPWGRAKPDLDRANYGALFGEPAIGTTTAVGCFPRGATPEGLHDMPGNVWEMTRTIMGRDLLEGKEGWVRSYVPRWWTRSLLGNPWLGSEFGYPYDPKDGRESIDTEVPVDRAVRGGSWTVDARRLRCAFRDGLPQTNRHIADGLRMAVSPVK